MTVAAVHQPQYLPYLGFFDKLAGAEVLVSLDHVQFHRRGLQHRNKIKTRQGWQWLTVPVLQRSDQLVREVTINPTEPWQRKHANALQWNYGRAPFFDTYGGQLLELLQRPWRTLSDLNVTLIRWIMEALGIDRPIVSSSDLGVSGRRSELLAELCRAVGADTYLSGPGGRRYIEPDPFTERGIDVRWQDFSYPRYAQLFPDAGFISDLSIVDTLFCCGPETSSFLGVRP